MTKGVTVVFTGCGKYCRTLCNSVVTQRRDCHHEAAIKKAPLSSVKRGRGGRSSFNGMVCTVFGNTGFLGKSVVNQFGKIGSQLVIPYRGDEYDVMRLRPMGDLGQINFLPFDLRDEESIRKSLKYSNVAVNLIGRDFTTKNYNFNDVHVEGARRLARIARECGVEKFVHVSSLNVAEKPQGHVLKNGSEFLRTKWLGEKAVREEFPGAVIFRPADMYGQEDRFLLYYSHWYRRTAQAIPLWKKGEHTVKAPVYFEDVAKGIVKAVLDKDTVGKTYEAVGPKRYVLADLVDWFFALMHRDGFGYVRYDSRFDPLFWFKVTLAERISWDVPYVSWDKFERENVTDVTTGCPRLEDLGVELTHIEDRAPFELRPFSALAYYDAQLGEFETPPNPKIVL